LKFEFEIQGDYTHTHTRAICFSHVSRGTCALSRAINFFPSRKLFQIKQQQQQQQRTTTRRNSNIKAKTFQNINSQKYKNFFFSLIKMRNNFICKKSFFFYLLFLEKPVKMSNEKYFFGKRKKLTSFF